MGPRTKTSLHYEAAFEEYLRHRGLPYVAVNETKKALLAGAALKSFDFVVYHPAGKNMLVDVKGRLCHPAKSGSRVASLQNWVTRQDIDDLRLWQEIFGPDFEAIFLFMYHWTGEPELAPFPDLFLFHERWYTTQTISLNEYRKYMKARSAAWGTVHLAVGDFRAQAKPFDLWLGDREQEIGEPVQ